MIPDGESVYHSTTSINNKANFGTLVSNNMATALIPEKRRKRDRVTAPVHKIGDVIAGAGRAAHRVGSAAKNKVKGDDSWIARRRARRHSLESSNADAPSHTGSESSAPHLLTESHQNSEASTPAPPPRARMAGLAARYEATKKKWNFRRKQTMALEAKRLDELKKKNRNFTSSIFSKSKFCRFNHNVDNFVILMFLSRSNQERSSATKPPPPPLPPTPPGAEVHPTPPKKN